MGWWCWLNPALLPSFSSSSRDQRGIKLYPLYLSGAFQFSGISSFSIISAKYIHQDSKDSSIIYQFNPERKAFKNLSGMLASLKSHKWREEESQTIKRLDNSEEDRDHQITITTATSFMFFLSFFMSEYIPVERKWRKRFISKPKKFICYYWEWRRSKSK